MEAPSGISAVAIIVASAAVTAAAAVVAAAAALAVTSPALRPPPASPPIPTSQSPPPAPAPPPDKRERRRERSTDEFDRRASGKGRRNPSWALANLASSRRNSTFFLGSKHERKLEEAPDSKETRVGVSRGNHGEDLRRGRHSPAWISLWALRMITLPPSNLYKVQKKG